MNVGGKTIHLLVAGLGLLASAEASAQRTMYRCVVDGRSTLSDRPCEGRPSTSLTAVGPLRDRPAYSSGDVSPGRAVDYLDYMSPVCAELNEGMRNGPARGLRSGAMSELRRSYQERCSEEEQVARQRLGDEQSHRREVRNRELAEEKAERERQKLSREQCDEMYRILHGRRAKVATMSPGERSDFQRFEATWQARCKPG